MIIILILCFWCFHRQMSVQPKTQVVFDNKNWVHMLDSTVKFLYFTPDTNRLKNSIYIPRPTILFASLIYICLTALVATLLLWWQNFSYDPQEPPRIHQALKTSGNWKLTEQLVLLVSKTSVIQWWMF